MKIQPIFNELITEYLYSARYDVMWYYGWDVASGCIWGNGVIKNINKIYF